MSEPQFNIADLVPSAPLPQEVASRITLVDVAATEDMPQFTAVFVEGHEPEEVDRRTCRLMDSKGVAHAMFHRPARTSRGSWAAHGYLYF